MATDTLVSDVVSSAGSNAEKTKSLANVTKKVNVTGKVLQSDYAIVSAVLLKDIIPVLGSIKAQKELPGMLSEFIAKQFAAKAKAAKKAIAVRKVLAANREEIEADSK